MRERQLHGESQRAYERNMAKVQADAWRVAEERSAGERKQRADAEARLRALEVQLADTRRKAELAKAEADASRAAVEDANATLAQSESTAAALRSANERLKEKLKQANEAREAEAQEKLTSLQQWQGEIKEAREMKGRAEQQMREAALGKRALEERVRELEASQSHLQSALGEAQKAKEDFVFSLQMANERLKEKLRVSEESRAHLAQQLEGQEQLSVRAVALQHKLEERGERVRELEAELAKAHHYKEDWMNAVKQRVLAEERVSQARSKQGR